MPKKTNELKKDASKKSTKNVELNKKLKTTSTNSTKTSKSKVATKNLNSKTKLTTNAKKASTKKTTKKSVSIVEYYDLPYRYNQTIVKILAQTPQMLFVYWDISDADRTNFEKQYGNEFFSTTKPVLIVHNTTMNYSFEVEINDFANSWYLHVNDPNCKYEIELGRRPCSHMSSINEAYIYVSSSNNIDAPNNHILFENFKPEITYKNTSTGTISTKHFSTISNYKNMQKIYNIYDLYKKIYKDDLFNEILTQPTNPSSIF